MRSSIRHNPPGLEWRTASCNPTNVHRRMHPFVMGLECTAVWKSPALPLPRTLLLHCFVLFSTLGVNRLQLCAHLSPNYAKRHQESWNSRLWTQEKFMSGLTMALRRRNLRDPGCRKVNWQGAKGRGGFLAGARNSDNNNHFTYIRSFSFTRAR